MAATVARTLRLTFLGTRGEVSITSRLHRRHSAVLVECGRTRIMIDRGRDWLVLPARLRPTAILLTHAHSDHAGGLAEGSAVPVFATPETLQLTARFPIARRRAISPGERVTIGDITFVPYPVEHSLYAPAVGYRISGGRTSVFYVPDVAAPPQSADVLRGIALYVGDGATMVRSMVRRRGRHLIGHASIRMQLAWCAAWGVKRAIFTHCGSGIVRGDGRRSNATLQRLAKEAGVDARLAHDWMAIELP